MAEMLLMLYSPIRDKQYHISRLLDDTRLVDSNPSLANWTVKQYNMLG